MPSPALDTRRNRLNALALLLPGQWLALMAVFWMRFVPALRPFDFSVEPPPAAATLTAVACCLAPFVLPRAYFTPRRFERGALYRRMGVPLFRALAPDGDLVNRRLRRIEAGYRAVAGRRALADHLEGSIRNERWHLSLFVAGLLTQIFAGLSGQWGWAVVLTTGNLLFNAYPVLHQRYKRARARRAFAAAP
jgi:hypothetical protein